MKRADAYDQCGDVLALRSELANAVAMLPQIAKDRDRLEAIRASGNWVTSIGVTHPGAELFARWYNAIGSHYGWTPIYNETAQGLFTLTAMLAVQFFNLVLPFSWFCGNTRKMPSLLQWRCRTKFQFQPTTP